MSSSFESVKGTADDDNQNSVSDNEKISAIYANLTINVISNKTVANDFEMAARDAKYGYGITRWKKSWKEVLKRKNEQHVGKSKNQNVN